MWHLHQFPLCPFSRKVRLLLSEKGVAYELARANPWDNDDAFWELNPAGRTPVLRDPDRNITLCDSRAICEYIEETEDRSPMLSGTPRERAEIRRLIALFDENFFTDVTGPMLSEKLMKRLMRAPPSATALRDAMKLAHGHLDYLDYLIDNRPWLAGSRMSLADLAAAAQISVADYLGAIDWNQHDRAREWYSIFKSRPSFRPLLSERMEGLRPPAHYGEVDG